MTEAPSLSPGAFKAQVLFANEAFYMAFADGDAASMETLWAAETPVSCIHPGWGVLTDRAEIMESWRGVLQSPPNIMCRDPIVQKQSEDAALVVCFESVGNGHLIATNGFVREAGLWLMSHHQAGPTRAQPRTDPANDLPRTVN